MEHQLTKAELRDIKSKNYDRKTFKEIKRNEIYILLDDFKVHHNIGTIFRLADAILAKKVFLCGKTKTPPNYKISKSSRGAEKWVDFEYYENAEEIVKKLKTEGVEIVSVEITDKSIDYKEYLPNSNGVCIILGREYDGVSQNLLNLSDKTIHLPIYGMCNSINVSTAGAVVLYDVLDKLTKKKKNKK